MAMREIVQIGIVVEDLEKAMEKYWKIFGIGPWDIRTVSPPLLESTPYTRPPNYSFRNAIAKVKNIEIELIQPLEGPTLHKDHLTKKGEGLHHIKEKVDDIPGTIEKFKKMGIGVIQGGKFGKDEHYYLDTEDMLGFVFELGNNGLVPPPEARYPPEIRKGEK